MPQQKAAQSVASKRQLLSLCGKLIGRYPVGSWLQVACGYMKRQISDSGRNKPISLQVLRMLEDVLPQVRECNQVQGK